LQYSQDGLHWTALEDTSQQGVRDRIFPASFDPNSVTRQLFGRLLEARLLRVHPLKWHRAIGLRLEVLGCFLPYRQSWPTERCRNIYLVLLSLSLVLESIFILFFEDAGAVVDVQVFTGRVEFLTHDE
jgi:hypothetical protein